MAGLNNPFSGLGAGEKSGGGVEASIDGPATYAQYRLKKHQEAQKAWREKNKGRIAEYMRKWKERNPERVSAHRHANKKRVKTKALIELMARQEGRCAYCKESLTQDRHVDHVVPKARGGADDIGNYQFLCPTCNMAKGGLTGEEFFAHIRKILKHHDQG